MHFYYPEVGVGGNFGFCFSSVPVGADAVAVVAAAAAAAAAATVINLQTFICMLISFCWGRERDKNVPEKCFLPRLSTLADLVALNSQ